MANNDKFAVQMRVRVKVDGAKSGSGVIVEDFGDHAGHAVKIGDQHIVDAARRWAVLLDSGSLVFVDDKQLSPE